MNILWISGSRIVGGAEHVTLQVLGELRRRGHLVSALYRHSLEFENALRAEGIHLHPANLGGSLNFPATFSIGRALWQLRPDIAVVTTSDEWVWASLVPRPSKTRLVLVRHMALALPAKVRRLAKRRSDAVIAVSEAARGSLRLPPGIDEAHLHVIPNPVRLPIHDRPPSSGMRIEYRKALSLPAEEQWIGFFGGGEPNKGIRDVLQAVRLIGETLDGCHLLVCGRRARDVHFPSVEQLAADYGLDDGRVCYLGQIEKVEQAIIACNAIVIATHRSLSEGAPLIALEAMACGIPIVGYATGGIAEVIGAGEVTGLLARPDDPEDLARQLSRILRDNILAMNLASAALERARVQFNPVLAGDRYESLFSDLCARATRD